MIKEKWIKETHFQTERDKIIFFINSLKTLTNLRMCFRCLFGGVTWNFQFTRWTTNWYISSPFDTAFSIVVLLFFGQLDTTLWIYTPTCRLLLFFIDLILSFGLNTLEQKANLASFFIRQVDMAILKLPFLRSFHYFFPFSQNSIHAFVQTPNT